MRIVFVCTGNTCRSPMAEALMRRALHSAGRVDILVSSAGVAARFGDRASENAISAMDEYGLDIRSHAARPLTAGIARESLLLCMTQGQLRAVKRAFPDARADTLAHFSGGTSDISDPYGGPLETYRRTAREIERAIQTIITEGKI